MSEAKLEKEILDDPDTDILPEWLEKAESAVPNKKRLISLRIDSEVIDWFKTSGDGYQSRINAVLRTFMQIKRLKRD